MFNPFNELFLALGNFVPCPESYPDRRGQVLGIGNPYPGPLFHPVVVSCFNKPLTWLLFGAYIDGCNTLGVVVLISEPHETPHFLQNIILGLL
jgi:hypothetical protein